MISHRNDVITLLEEYINTQREQTYQFWMSDAEEWSQDRQSLYMDGIVLGKFREGDPMTMQTLEKGVSSVVK